MRNHQIHASKSEKKKKRNKGKYGSLDIISEKNFLRNTSDGEILPTESE